MNQEMKPSEILALAEVYLDECGWVQGRFHNELGQVCAIGALRLAYGGQDPTRDVYFEAWAWLEDVIGKYVGKWNDAPGRTVEEVKAAFRKARDLAAKEGR